MALPLKISAIPGAWPLFAKRKASKVFRDKINKVLKRDDYTCQFCSFQAQRYQEVVCKDGNFNHVKDNNLICACCFCTQCFFIESVGEQGYGGGTIVFLPELSQTQLNSLCHVLFCAIANGTAYRESAQTIYRALRMRSQQTEEMLGEGMSTPSIFGQLLIEYQIDKGKIPETVTKNLRLLPSRASFKTQIEKWAADALAEFSERE